MNKNIQNNAHQFKKGKLSFSILVFVLVFILTACGDITISPQNSSNNTAIANEHITPTPFLTMPAGPRTPLNSRFGSDVEGYITGVLIKVNSDPRLLQNIETDAQQSLDVTQSHIRNFAKTDQDILGMVIRDSLREFLLTTSANSNIVASFILLEKANPFLREGWTADLLNASTLYALRMSKDSKQFEIRNAENCLAFETSANFKVLAQNITLDTWVNTTYKEPDYYRFIRAVAIARVNTRGYSDLFNLTNYTYNGNPVNLANVKTLFETLATPNSYPPSEQQLKELSSYMSIFFTESPDYIKQCSSL